MLLVATGISEEVVGNVRPPVRRVDDDWVQLTPSLLPTALEDCMLHNVLLRGEPWLSAGAVRPEVDWYLGRLVKACGLFIGEEVFGPADVRAECLMAERPEERGNLVKEAMGHRVYPINPAKFVGCRNAKLIFLTADCKRTTPMGSSMWAQRFIGLPFHEWGFATIDCPASALAGAERIIAVSSRAYEWAHLYVPAVDLQLDSELEKFNA